MSDMPSDPFVGEFVQARPDGTRRLHLAVPDAYCGTCIQAIEGALAGLPGIREARVNLDRRQVRIDFDRESDPSTFGHAVARSGYRNHPIDPRDIADKDPALRELVSGLVVSGFATAHTMFLSEAIWAGAEGGARSMFYWVSALVAVPAVGYAGRPFFRSAWSALRALRTNMDVPIAIALVATTGISLLETGLGGAHAYFDASTMLLFFLLIGRTLDHLMRGQARNAASNLARLAPRGSQRILDDGTTAFVRSEDIETGTRLLLRPGERSPVDCRTSGTAATIDLSLVNGESMPHETGPDEAIPAGALVLSRPVAVVASARAEDSYLERTAALMAAVETTRTRYRRIADRASDLYAPLVHGAAVVTFVFWSMSGAGWRQALLDAVSVLVVTCPCALALAVPIVHVVAAGRLFAQGVLMKDGAALERLATVRHIAFDKTGTLTEGRPRLLGQTTGDPGLLPLAAAIAAASTHPLSQALAASCPGTIPDDCREIAGAGVEARVGGKAFRLGNAGFCGLDNDGDGDRSRVLLACDGYLLASFEFEDRLRDDALPTVRRLQAAKATVCILSGDRGRSVALVADELGGIASVSGLAPEEKARAVVALRQSGGVAMVGDGINDVVALRAADVSFAPSAAADIGRAAADFILTNDKLEGVPFALWLARKADTLVRQNLVLSIAYNMVFLPLAASGMLTPSIAAIAMSSSSFVVVLNALRLRVARAPSTGTTS